MSRLLVAKSAGFCHGVARAVDMAEAMLTQGGESWSLGPIIHNDDLVRALEQRGLHVAQSAADIPAGARALIRSHGASPAEIAALREKNVEIVDATCPNVAHIHAIAQAAAQAGRQLLVLGDGEHPEVRGICARCPGALVFPHGGALIDWLKEAPARLEMPLTLVFQTTLKRSLKMDADFFLKKECTNAEIFDTICGATSIRQKEAAALSAQCGAMVVIGGRQSANSRHLAQICREGCSNVQFVENAAGLDTNTLSGVDTIGITAGASAPAWIIKEVKQKMSDEIKIEEMTNEQPQAVEETPVVEETPAVEEIPAEEEIPQAEEVEKSFAEMLEESIKTIYNGETVSGVVVAITPTEVTLDLGIKHSGYIPVTEFTEDGSAVEEHLKVGDTVEACVVRVNDVEGTVMLSKKRLDAVKSWGDIELAQENETAVEGTVTEENKGGVVVSVRGIRVFIPASQTGLGKNVPMTELVGQKVRLKITEVNRSRRRVVGSIRAIAQKERRELADKIWNDIEIGKRYHGVVKSLTSYGAFVDIGGIDGMVHVSELSWSRISKPADVVNVGDELDVYVIGFDKEKHKISLGYKDPDANPWNMFKNSYEVGSTATVKIVKLMPFGAFAEVMPGVDGLIHISQIANRRIGKPEEVLTVGDEVEVKITGIDDDKQKISLSIRALTEPEHVPVQRDDEERPAPAAREPEADALVYEVSASGEATGLAPETEQE